MKSGTVPNTTSRTRGTVRPFRTAHKGGGQCSNSEFLIYLSFPNILDNYTCFVVSYLSVSLRIFDELVGKIVIRKPRESYAVTNLIFMGLQF